MAKVLLVDDEPDILLMLRMSFEDEGHEVVMAADGRMGLERLAEHHPQGLAVVEAEPLGGRVLLVGLVEQLAAHVSPVLVAARSAALRRA